jgi:hypothetical protein
MNSKVKVTANEDGKVVIPSPNNPSFGYVRVEQERGVTDENGWMRVKTVTALVPGTVNDLNKLGWVKGQLINGTIVIREQLTPFNKRNPERDLKIAGSTGIVCKVDDQPIYRNTFYNTNPNAQDTIIAHTNIEEIKAAYSGSASLVSETEEIDDFSL